MNSLRAPFIDFQKSDVRNNDYLQEFQARVATLDEYSANVLEMIPSLLEDETKEKYNKEVKHATKLEFKLELSSFIADQCWKINFSRTWPWYK